MATPTEADIHGPAAADIETHLKSATLSGPERVRLFWLAWNTCILPAASRHRVCRIGLTR
jgi:4-hydroxyphenylacetate 3-monooxygenase